MHFLLLFLLAMFSPPAPLQTDLALAYRVAVPAASPTRLLILLHGVGSNELDLIPVGQQLADTHTLTLSVQAPLPLGANAYGFYQVDFATGKPVFNQAQQQASQQRLTRFINEAVARYHVPAGRVYLLGFSQGAIMAYAVALASPAKVRGVLAFSGRMLEESRQHPAPAAQLQQVRFFISHGRQDDTLPVAYAGQAVAFLQSQGIKPQYEAFGGGHEIPTTSLAAAKEWLQ